MDDVRTKLRETKGALMRSQADHVVVCNAKDLERISAQALRLLEEAHRLSDILRQAPSQAVPSSGPFEAWLDRRLDLNSLHQMFAKCLLSVFPVVPVV